MNNLITVNQGVQTRSFAYDSLSRLKQASNPESGIINYVYDNNSNLTSKTDARNVVTNYVYDNLNRVKNRNYTAPINLPNYQITPNVTYTYDNLPNAKGKLIKVNSSVSTTEYTSFDILGRVQNHKQITDGNIYNSSHVYNLSGALIEETYPSGRVVKNTLDADGDLAQVQSKRINGTFQNYANAFTYTSAGAVSSLRLGNGKFENTTFNSRLQPTQIGLGSSATSQNLLKLNFEYGATDAENNGNVTKQTITVPTEIRNNVTYNAFTATQNYTYDSLNRLKSAVEMQGTTQNWKQTFKFDRYGNRTFDTTSNNTTTLANGCPVAICNPSANPTNNKLVGTNYDNVGNTSQDANGQVFVYDAENKQVQVNNASGIVGQYFYDGDGKRIKKFVPSTSETTIFVYDAGGKMVAEYSTVSASTTEAKISYLTNDHLGSPRITTDATGKVISRRDFMPFGEEITRANYGSDSIREKFATYERDGETGLDYAQARMFGSGLGRFTSPDPTLLSARGDNPQTWNRYVYVLNNPLKFVDPFGLWELQYEPEYEKNKDGTYDTSKVKSIKVFFVKTKKDDDADSLLSQLGFNSKDKGYGDMKAQIEGAITNMTTTEMGTTGISAPSLKGSVDGVNIGGAFTTIGNLLGEQSNYDGSHSGNYSSKNSKGPSAFNHDYGDCTETTARLSFGVPITDNLSELGTQDGSSGMDERFIGNANSQNGSLRILDAVRYNGNGDSTKRHYMSVVFTGDDGTTQAFSRSGVGGRFEIVPANAFNGGGYGNVGGTSKKHSGFYRP